MISRIGPSHTPKVLAKLIIITASISLFFALFESFAPRLQPYFILSWWGVSHFLLWQPVTYLFVIDSLGGGITLFYLLYLFFSMYILWIMGAAVIEYGGRRPFLKLYFGTGIAAALVALLLLYLTGSATSFAGPAAPLLALFTIWTMLNPEMEILLFFIIPIRVKYLFLGVIGAILLISISQLAIISLFLYATGILAGYLFASFAFELKLPFPQLDAFDSWIFRLGNRFRIPKESESKIIQLFTGKSHLDDDEFLDEMLAKISEEGPGSLTSRERKRMDAIAKKRQK